MTSSWGEPSDHQPASRRPLIAVPSRRTPPPAGSGTELSERRHRSNSYAGKLRGRWLSASARTVVKRENLRKTTFHRGSCWKLRYRQTALPSRRVRRAIEGFSTMMKYTREMLASDLRAARSPVARAKIPTVVRSLGREKAKGYADYFKSQLSETTILDWRGRPMATKASPEIKRIENTGKHIMRGLHFHFGGEPLPKHYRILTHSAAGERGLASFEAPLTNLLNQATALRRGGVAGAFDTTPLRSEMPSSGCSSCTTTSGGSSSRCQGTSNWRLDRLGIVATPQILYRVNRRCEPDFTPTAQVGQGCVPMRSPRTVMLALC